MSALINPDSTVNDIQVSQQAGDTAIPYDLRDLVWNKSYGSAASDGAYMKSESAFGGVKYYLKLSNYDISRGIFGHESVNEIIAERLGRLLGFNVPEGKLKKCLVTIEENDYTAYVYMSKTFKPNDVTRVSFEDFYRSFRLKGETPLELCLRYGWADDIYKMFVFDYLIINRDRHGGNLEVLKNTGPVHLSPLFDNGLSFLCTNTDVSTVNAFDAMLDRPVNNFIGERSLAKNLMFIDKKLRFEELQENHRELLFKGLDGVLPSVYYDKIWETLTRRWPHVKEFRAS